MINKEKKSIEVYFSILSSYNSPMKKGKTSINGSSPGFELPLALKVNALNHLSQTVQFSDI